MKTNPPYALLGFMDITEDPLYGACKSGSCSSRLSLSLHYMYKHSEVILHFPSGRLISGFHLKRVGLYLYLNVALGCLMEQTHQHPSSPSCAELDNCG